MLNRYQ